MLINEFQLLVNNFYYEWTHLRIFYKRKVKFKILGIELRITYKIRDQTTVHLQLCNKTANNMST